MLWREKSPAPATPASLADDAKNLLSGVNPHTLSKRK